MKPADAMAESNIAYGVEHTKKILNSELGTMWEFQNLKHFCKVLCSKLACDEESSKYYTMDIHYKAPRCSNY